MDTMGCVREYEGYLRAKGFSESTVQSYVWVAAFFLRNYGCVQLDSLAQYREWLVQTFKPCTANQRIQAINCYVTYLGKQDLKLRNVRVQQRLFLEHGLSDEDFRNLLSHLRDGNYDRDYHAVRIMATTGMRVSELLRVTVEDLRRGYIDLSSKGKARRVYIPSATCEEALAWLAGEGRASGAIFLNRFGGPISSRGLAQQLKSRAVECNVDERAVHPHAFRHLFARRFLEAGGELSFLADLLGHSSLETTRIYLRRTTSEQHDELNRLVSW